jgi:hypothetical protein
MAFWSLSVSPSFPGFLAAKPEVNQEVLDGIPNMIGLLSFLSLP